MKKFFFLAAAFVAGFGAMAQQKADEVIRVSTDKHDFGKIKKGVPVTTYFTITNTSDKPVVIENAWAGCGCTTPEYSKEPIPAGGVSKLKVGYNAAAMGHFDKDVNIKLVGIQETKIVKITGEVADDASSVAVKTDTKVSASTDAKLLVKPGKSAKATKVKKVSK